MADKKLTRAQQAAEHKKRKKVTVVEDAPKGRRAAKDADEAPKTEKRDPRAVLRGDAVFPLRYAFAGFCGLLLLIFLSVLFTNDGLVLQWIVSFVSGMFGRNVYYNNFYKSVYI